MRCAVFRHENGRHCRELSEAYIMKTVVAATKTVVMVMKTVVMPIKRRISLGIFRPISTFVCNRRFSGSSAFPRCQDFLLFSNKGISFFYFLPVSFYRLLINPDLKDENVRHESSKISFQIEKCSNKGYCLFLSSVFSFSMSSLLLLCVTR